LILLLFSALTPLARVQTVVCAEASGRIEKTIFEDKVVDHLD
jgi:hypothetical protein